MQIYDIRINFFDYLVICSFFEQFLCIIVKTCVNLMEKHAFIHLTSLQSYNGLDVLFLLALNNKCYLFKVAFSLS